MQSLTCHNVNHTFQLLVPEVAPIVNAKVVAVVDAPVSIYTRLNIVSFKYQLDKRSI
jgi:hypothetical protein